MDHNAAYILITDGFKDVLERSAVGNYKIRKEPLDHGEEEIN